jgi:hypothetical protein
VLVQEHERRAKVLANVLTPDPAHTHHFRRFFDKSGLVASALPPVENQRLSSQQGAFMLNGADEKAFQESLSMMMKGAGRN